MGGESKRRQALGLGWRDRYAAAEAKARAPRWRDAFLRLIDVLTRRNGATPPFAELVPLVFVLDWTPPVGGHRFARAGIPKDAAETADEAPHPITRRASHRAMRFVRREVIVQAFRARGFAGAADDLAGRPALDACGRLPAIEIVATSGGNMRVDVGDIDLGEFVNAATGAARWPQVERLRAAIPATAATFAAEFVAEGVINLNV